MRAPPIAVPSPVDAAVSVTVVGFGRLAGAVYSPLEETVPQLTLGEQALPEMLQVTGAAGLDDAVNCWVPLRATRAELGNTETRMSTMRTLILRNCLVSTWEVAVTVTVEGFVGGVAGAVNKPVELMDPQALPVQLEPETLQVTA